MTTQRHIFYLSAQPVALTIVTFTLIIRCVLCSVRRRNDRDQVLGQMSLDTGTCSIL